MNTTNDTTMEYCKNTTISQVPDLKLQLYLQYLLGTIIALLVIVTIAGNIMTVTAYIIDKQLKTVYNTYIFNLAITDLFIGLMIMPFGGCYTVNDFSWKLGRPFCKVWLATAFTLRLESVFMILMLCYDRFILVRFGHRYENKVTMKITIVKIAITWIVAFAVYGPAIIGWDIWSGCTIVGENVCDVEFAQNPHYTIIAAFLEFFVSFKGLVIINGLLFYKIRRLISKNVKTDNETEGFIENDTDDTLAEPSEVANSSHFNENESKIEPSENKQEVRITSCKETKTEATEETVSGAAINETVTDDDGKALSTAELEESNKQERALDDKVYLYNKDHSSSDDSKSVSNTQKEPKKDDEQVKTEEESKKPATLNVKTTKRQSEGETPSTEETKRKSGTVAKTHVRSKSDTTDTEPGEIMKSVMKVMEKHGSGILLETDLTTDFSNDAEIEDDSGINESATANDNEVILETATPGSDLAGSLRRKISDYASRVLYKRHSGENVGLEKLNDNESYEERNIDVAIAEKERQDAAMAKRKASTQSTVSSIIRRNTEAVRFLAMLVGVFLVCWAPYTIATIRNAFCKECVDKIVYEFLTWLLWLKSAINPFLYAYNSSRYRNYFHRFLCVCCRKEN